MSQTTIEKADMHICQTYKRFPLVMTRGKGCRLWDDQGREYIDFVAGVAVCNLGHAHPAVAKALTAQAEALVHVSNLFYTEPQTTLAEFLVQNSFGDRVFFCNSGTEANEAAIKMARRYFKDQGEPQRFRIITMHQSFHGRTMGSLSATGQDKIQKGFEPLLDGFDLVPFNDAQALDAMVSPATCAVIIEPVQGEGGVIGPQEGYLKAVRQICDKAGILLIFDEVQTGIGRTGKLFAYEHFGVEPDIMTLAKALGNGLPIGALVARQAPAAAFSAGAHGSTFGGTPAICAAALSTLDTLVKENIIEQAAAMGAYFKTQLQELAARHEVIEEVRGLGLLLGLKLAVDGEPIMQTCMQKGFLINCIQGNVLRFIPPLIIGKQEIDALIGCLDDILGSKG